LRLRLLVNKTKVDGEINIYTYAYLRAVFFQMFYFKEKLLKILNILAELTLRAIVKWICWRRIYTVSRLSPQGANAVCAQTANGRQLHGNATVASHAESRECRGLGARPTRPRRGCAKLPQQIQLSENV